MKVSKGTVGSQKEDLDQPPVKSYSAQRMSKAPHRALIQAHLASHLQYCSSLPTVLHGSTNFDPLFVRIAGEFVKKILARKRN